MKAVLCKAFGPPENLVIEEIASPVPGAGQVRITVAAAGVNFTDNMIVQGKRGAGPGFPFSPGMEVAGTIDSVGPDVTELKLGMRVVSFCRIGGYAEEVIAPAATTFPISDDIDFITAAGVLIGHGTAQYALKERGKLQPGETLLVLGAGGGVGLAAVEVGKVMGATVIAAASSAEKRSLARAAGADFVLDSTVEDLPAQVTAAAGQHGVDVFYDPVGGPNPEPLMSTLRWRGRHLIVGTASGQTPRVSFDVVFFKELALMGVFWGPAMLLDPRPHAANVAELLGWCGQEKISPRVVETPRLDEAPSVLRRAMERQLSGKVVLVTGR